MYRCALSTHHGGCIPLGGFHDGTRFGTPPPSPTEQLWLVPASATKWGEEIGNETESCQDETTKQPEIDLPG